MVINSPFILSQRLFRKSQYIIFSNPSILAPSNNLQLLQQLQYIVNIHINHLITLLMELAYNLFTKVHLLSLKVNSPICLWITHSTEHCILQSASKLPAFLRSLTVVLDLFFFELHDSCSI